MRAAAMRGSAHPELLRRVPPLALGGQRAGGRVIGQKHLRARHRCASRCHVSARARHLTVACVAPAAASRSFACLSPGSAGLLNGASGAASGGGGTAGPKASRSSGGGAAAAAGASVHGSFPCCRFAVLTGGGGGCGGLAAAGGGGVGFCCCCCCCGGVNLRGGGGGSGTACCGSLSPSSPQAALDAAPFPCPFCDAGRSASSSPGGEARCGNSFGATPGNLALVASRTEAACSFDSRPQPGVVRPTGGGGGGLRGDVADGSACADALGLAAAARRGFHRHRPTVERQPLRHARSRQQERAELQTKLCQRHAQSEERPQLPHEADCEKRGSRLHAHRRRAAPRVGRRRWLGEHRGSERCRLLCCALLCYRTLRRWSTLLGEQLVDAAVATAGRGARARAAPRRLATR